MEVSQLYKGAQMIWRSMEYDNVKSDFKIKINELDI